MLDLAAVVQQVDTLYAQNRGKDAESLLKENIVQAVQEEDDNALLTLLNELIGYYRETSKVEESFALADQALVLIKQMGLEGTLPYATTLLNIANAYRAGGRLKDSLHCYEKTMAVYDKLLSSEDMLVASLHNNMSLLYQEMGQFEAAKQSLLHAFKIVSCHEEAYFELAVTCANLANTCLTLNEDEEASGYFQNAIRLFEEHGIEDAHYSAALSSLGTYYFKQGNYEAAAGNFIKAMECMRKNLGENEYYHRLKENLELCEEKLAVGRGDATASEENISVDKEKMGKGIVQTAPERMSGLALSRAYYEAYGKPMIQEQFSDYEDKIAVGLAGEGSDCFGFDDETSRDHDWGPDFCMWITEETEREIGNKLREAYAALPQEFMGYTRAVSARGNQRRGVQTINSFYGRLLGTRDWEKIGEAAVMAQDNEVVQEQAFDRQQVFRQEQAFWQSMQDASLAAAVNGEIFCDPQGIFSSVRKQLAAGYPQQIQYLKLAESAARFAQTGQYNYARMLNRGDNITAMMMLGDCLKEATKLCYYMENQYPPHDKWLVKGLGQLAEGEEIQKLLQNVTESIQNISNPKEGESYAGKSGEAVRAEMSSQNRVTQAIEDLAAKLVQMMYSKGFISDTDPYLDAHTGELLAKSRYASKTNAELVNDIAQIEFTAFDKVRNVGGRASCQDDWFTFSIMRKSQYLTWNRTMLLQYLYDFKRELSRGHNLIEEKYGRMMESTAPQEYERIKEHFPKLSEQKKQIIEAVVQMQVGWMEEFEKCYPTLAGNARSIHTSEDNLYNTSYETYLRGEISTYSDKMLELYGRYVVEYARNGENLTDAIMKNSVEMYGYRNLEEAEEQMSRLRI